MSLITLRGVGVLSPRPLFRGLDLAIHPGDHIGLVAGNGAGKTTLLRCLAGQAEPGAGDITRRRGLRIAFVEQDVPPGLLGLSMTEAISRALPAADRDAESWRTCLTLDAFDAPADMRARALSALSGGWQRIALLARAWVTDPDLLLLDEPTNHLDTDRLASLEAWMRTATAGVAMVVASHDRQFLDDCTTRTLFLRSEGSRAYTHPFSRARILLAGDDAAAESRHASDAKEAERLRRNAGKLRNVGINSGSDLLLKKSKQLGARAEAIEQGLRPMATERTGDIRLASRGTHAKLLLRLDDVVVRAPDGQPLFRTGVVKLFAGDRVVLSGANGAGKSQLLRLLDGAIRHCATVPGITASPTLVVGYLDQSMSQLPPARTPHAHIAGLFDVGDGRARGLLAGAGIDAAAQGRSIGLLSPGQRARLGLLALRLLAPNFYLLDEPTNHVDIPGQERLEAQIVAQEATALVVSHDRFFVRAIGTRFLRIEDGRLFETDG